MLKGSGMKRVYFLSMLALLLIVAACGKKGPEPRYTADAKEYQFFKAVSDTFQIPVLNPNESAELVKTKSFSVYNNDVMPGLYRALNRYSNNLKVIPRPELIKLVKQAAQQEAERKLLLASATEKEISVPEDTVQAELAKIYANFGGKDKFVQNISAQGFTLDFVENDVKDNLIVQKYLNKYVYKNISVDEEQIQESYSKDKTATVQHILMMTQGKSDEEKQAIRKKMEDVLAQARAGKDFGELAKKYSEDPGSKDKGGLYEKFPKGQMVKPFEDAAFNLPIGSISDLVETQYGYHIIKVLGREKETRPLEEVRGEITTKLTNAKKQDEIKKYLKKLKTDNKYQEVYTG